MSAQTGLSAVASAKAESQDQPILPQPLVILAYERRQSRDYGVGASRLFEVAMPHVFFGIKGAPHGLMAFGRHRMTRSRRLDVHAFLRFLLSLAFQ